MRMFNCFVCSHSFLCQFCDHREIIYIFFYCRVVSLSAVHCTSCLLSVWKSYLLYLCKYWENRKVIPEEREEESQWQSWRTMTTPSPTWRRWTWYLRMWATTPTAWDGCVKILCLTPDIGTQTFQISPYVYRKQSSFGYPVAFSGPLPHFWSTED